MGGVFEKSYFDIAKKAIELFWSDAVMIEIIVDD